MGAGLSRRDAATQIRVSPRPSTMLSMLQQRRRFSRSRVVHKEAAHHTDAMPLHVVQLHCGVADDRTCAP